MPISRAAFIAFAAVVLASSAACSGSPDESVESSGEAVDPLQGVACKGPFDCKLPNHGAANANRATDPKNGTPSWPLRSGTLLRDGFGDVRGTVADGAVQINYGQRKRIGNATYVYAFAVRLTNGGASGWIDEKDVVDDIARLMPTVSGRDPGLGDYATAFTVTGGNLAAFGDLKVDPNYTGSHEAATDYLVRDGNVFNLLYNLPGVGGVATDTLPIGARFHRSLGVKAVEIPLYHPGGSVVVKHMEFVYGHVGSRYGWIAHAALAAK